MGIIPKCDKCTDQWCEYPDCMPLTRCRAGRDGECNAKGCPQINDNEPNRSGRSCPLADWEEF